MLQHAPASAKWNSRLMAFFSYANATDAFYITFCLFFLLLDAEWVAMGAR